MSVADPTQDAVSMGINATLRYIDKIDKSKVGLLILVLKVVWINLNLALYL